MTAMCFEDRADAGRRLAGKLGDMPRHRPLVLAVPRGGIEVALPIAQALHADLDVVLARKLRAPARPELALGAISESGEVHLNNHGRTITDGGRHWLEREKAHQREEMLRAAALFRSARPAAGVADRTVVIVDDGIATGATMLAALRAVRASRPREVVVAVPVAPAERLTEVASLADRVVCLEQPEDFQAVGQFYRRFEQVGDDRVLHILRNHGRAGRPPTEPVARAACIDPRD